jgi:hypothetical protein
LDGVASILTGSTANVAAKMLASVVRLLITLD